MSLRVIYKVRVIRNSRDDPRHSVQRPPTRASRYLNNPPEPGPMEPGPLEPAPLEPAPLEPSPFEPDPMERLAEGCAARKAECGSGSGDRVRPRAAGARWTR